MLEKGGLERFGEAVDAALDGAVQDVVADFNAKPAEELGIDFIFDGEFVAVVFGEAGLDFLALCGIERGGAFHDNCTARFFEANEALDRGEDGLEIAGLGGDEFGNQIPQLVVVKLAVHLAQTVETASGGGGDFGNFHRGRVSKGKLVADFGEGFRVDAVLVGIGEDFTGDLRSRIGDEATEFAFQLGGNALAVGVGSGLGFR